MNTTFKVRLNNDESVTLHRPAELDDSWRDAVELAPAPVLLSTQSAVPSYDFSTTPVTITYSVVELSVDERKQRLPNILNVKFRADVGLAVNNGMQDDATTPLDTTAIATLQAALINDLASISSATTHAELDAIII